ncbi:MAG: hypothetical protein KBD01_15365 [Acidobacteria bacterium]|nr:hypothetical protein [Acidobacteriota bacterium]
MFYFNVLMRWLHVASAAAALGSLFAARFILLPAWEKLGRGGDFFASIERPFRRLLHITIGLSLVTGLWNYLGVAVPRLMNMRERAQAGMATVGMVERLGPYHALMGTKILLAVVFFVISALLFTPIPAFQRNRRMWLTVDVIVGLLVLLLGAYIRRLW